MSRLPIKRRKDNSYLCPLMLVVKFLLSIRFPRLFLFQQDRHLCLHSDSVKNVKKRFILLFYIFSLYSFLSNYILISHLFCLIMGVFVSLSQGKEMCTLSMSLQSKPYFYLF